MTALPMVRRKPPATIPDRRPIAPHVVLDHFRSAWQADPAAIRRTAGLERAIGCIAQSVSYSPPRIVECAQDRAEVIRLLKSGKLRLPVEHLALCISPSDRDQLHAEAGDLSSAMVCLSHEPERDQLASVYCSEFVSPTGQRALLPNVMLRGFSFDYSEIPGGDLTFTTRIATGEAFYAALADDFTIERAALTAIRATTAALSLALPLLRPGAEIITHHFDPIANHLRDMRGIAQVRPALSVRRPPHQ